MKRLVAWVLCVTLALGTLPARAVAAVNVERRGDENPVVEVFRSTVYGFLGGVVVGGAIVLAVQDDNSSEEIMRWSIVGGTLIGLGAGIYWVTKRPQPSAMLELNGGALTLHPVAPEIVPGEGMNLRVFAVRF